MSTRGTMIQRIHNELHLTSATAVVNDSINSAIERYQTERFYFNDASWSFTLSSTANYSLPLVLPDYIGIDSVVVVYNGVRYPLEKERWAAAEAWDSTVRSMPPAKYAVFNDTLRVYPTPNAVATVMVTGHRRVSATDTTSSSVVWFNPQHAEELIRQAAKGRVCVDWLGDPERAGPWVPGPYGTMVPQYELEAYRALKARYVRSDVAGRIKPWL